MKFHIGAYAMSPCGQTWNEALETEFIEGLKILPFVAGLELPHFSTLDRWDEAYFFRRAAPEWDYVVSTLPSVSAALRSNNRFGLASTDEAGRRAALESVKVASTSVRRANDTFGKRAVRAVEIHSAPTGGTTTNAGSTAAFARSLLEIAGWDWDGAELVVEHCDAAIPGQDWQKGFLLLEEEIDAVDFANQRQPVRIRHSLNWGRSAIEGRSRDTPCRHAGLLLAGDRLRGAILSGCSGADTPFGAWQDTHMPLAPERYAPSGAEGALLTEREMTAFFAQAQHADLAFIGLKIAARPLNASVRDRLALLHSALLIATASRLASL